MEEQRAERGGRGMTQEEFARTYTAKLNAQQSEAVSAVDGAVLLLAVPGSGKTTVLVTRLGYMIYCGGIDPASILTMTYTVAATRDMAQRFASVFGPEYAKRLEFRTINGVSSKIIQYYSDHQSHRPVFKLLNNDSELAGIVRQIYQSVNDEYAETGTVKDIRTAITFIKNMMLTEAEIGQLDTRVRNLPEIYRRYQAELMQRKVMDYDDQMCYAKRILESCPSVLEHFQERYQYLCVDEAQDTSKIQHTIIHLLAQKHGNLFMVGDEDQSIYGFRAAWPDALMRFEQEYPGGRILFMEENYRSTEEIVRTANAFVAGNRFRREKSIRATQGSGEQVRIVSVESRRAQYQYLFHTAQNCKTETAVLYRNNDSALPLIDLLERGGVSYNVKSAEAPFFSSRLVCDIADILRFAGDPVNTEIFLRIFYKFGIPISRNAAQNACQRSTQSGKPILEELCALPELRDNVRAMVSGLIQQLPGVRTRTAADALLYVWSDLRYGQYAKKARLDEDRLHILLMLADHEPDAEGLLRRLEELKTITQTHDNLPENHFLLSTIHSSKGLEYETVYLCDVYDGILPTVVPGTGDTEDAGIYEEERRLYYVAMTRAKRALYLFSGGRDSMFTKEVISGLPRERIDPHDVFSVLRANLCGKTYRDRIYGSGRITAQCGDTALVSYQNGRTQMLTLEEMFHRRSKDVQYESPQAPEAPPVPARKAQDLRDITPERGNSTARRAGPQPIQEKQTQLTENQSPANGKSTVVSVRGPHDEIIRLVSGMRVHHAVYGDGEIRHVNEETVRILFPERSETRTFSLEFVLQKKLLQILPQQESDDLSV